MRTIDMFVCFRESGDALVEKAEIVFDAGALPHVSRLLKVKRSRRIFFQPTINIVLTTRCAPQTTKDCGAAKTKTSFQSAIATLFDERSGLLIELQSIDKLPRQHFDRAGANKRRCLQITTFTPQAFQCLRQMNSCFIKPAFAPI